MGTEPGLEPAFAGGKWRASWSVRLIPPDPVLQPDIIPQAPADGSSLAFKTSKPFSSNDEFKFTMKGGELDKSLAKDKLKDIFVVPNPYVATSDFEPANTYRSGRGERRIYFMNLPAECTIKIYTITGQLVNTIYHNSTIEDGQEAWNLVTKDGMNLSYGVYLYHVEAKGIGERTGRFAVIK